MLGETADALRSSYRLSQLHPPSASGPLLTACNRSGEAFRRSGHHRILWIAFLTLGIAAAVLGNSLDSSSARTSGSSTWLRSDQKSRCPRSTAKKHPSLLERETLLHRRRRAGALSRWDEGHPPSPSKFESLMTPPDKRRHRWHWFPCLRSVPGPGMEIPTRIGAIPSADRRSTSVRSASTGNGAVPLPMAATHECARIRRGCSTMRVLVAEDDPGLRSVLDRGLRGERLRGGRRVGRQRRARRTSGRSSTRWRSSTGGCRADRDREDCHEAASSGSDPGPDADGRDAPKTG